jgi:hypothetical protein
MQHSVASPRCWIDCFGLWTIVCSIPKSTPSIVGHSSDNDSANGRNVTSTIPDPCSLSQGSDIVAVAFLPLAVSLSLECPTMDRVDLGMLQTIVHTPKQSVQQRGDATLCCIRYRCYSQPHVCSMSNGSVKAVQFQANHGAPVCPS